LAWKGVLEFAVPQGNYSAATLTFSFSKAFNWWGSEISANPTVDIGFSQWVYWSPSVVDPYKQIDPMFDPAYARGGGGGTYGWSSYGSINITSAGSYSVSLSPAAVADINTAAGRFLNVWVSPLTLPPVPVGMGFPRGGAIETASLQLTAAVPEPAEWTMLIAGLLIIGLIAGARRA
jgi:hypothetical protein